MHEFSIARAMVEAACSEARRVGSDRVTRVVCRIGSLRQVDDRLMREAFDIARNGTACATAELTIERTNMEAACPRCRVRFAVRDWDWDCPTCGMLGEDAAGGDELELISLDAEVPDERAGAAECV